MAKCIYCGKSAGLLRKKHKECEEAHVSANDEIKKALHVMYENGVNDEQKACILAASDKANMDDEVLASVLVQGWEELVERAFEDGVLDEDEEAALMQISADFGLQNALQNSPKFEQIVQGKILKDVMDCKMPEEFAPKNSLQFNFQKNETVIYAIKNVDLLEVVSKKEVVGKSSGVSIRVAKGVYFRTGGFKGRTVETKELQHINTGELAITDKHIYFAGSGDSFRVRLNKIVSYTPYEDGIGIQKDGVRAKPQIFTGINGWFLQSYAKHQQFGVVKMSA